MIVASPARVSGERSMQTPLDALAEELGQFALGVRRELREARDLAGAEVRSEIAALRQQGAEMRLEAAALVQQVNERLAALKDGRDGDPGPPGPPVDQDALQKAVREAVEAIELPVGPMGPPGPEGVPGASVPGERGPEGLPGKLPIVSPWSERVWYVGEVAVLDGSLFQARCDTGKPPGTDDWVCLALRGADGTDGRSFRVVGTWREGVVYETLDVVALNGASFAAKRDHPGICPGEDWQMIASQGKRGNQGDIGKRGEPGPAGVVRTISVNDEGLLMLTNGDGSVVTCDLYPLLIRIAR